MFGLAGPWTSGTALANLGQPLLDSLDPGSESSTPQLTPKGSSGVRHVRTSIGKLILMFASVLIPVDTASQALGKLCR